MKRNRRKNSPAGAIGTGIAVSAGTATLLAAVLTLLTQRQSLWEGLPPGALCVGLVQTLSVAAGTMVVLKVGEGKLLPSAEAAGAGFFLLLTAVHGILKDTTSNLVLSFGICFGLPAVLAMLCAKGQKRRFKAPKTLYARNMR